MSFSDPEAKQRNIKGFWDCTDVDSIIRAVRQDHGDRLFNSIQYPNDPTAQVERTLHQSILMHHMYVSTFSSAEAIRRFICHSKPENAEQKTMKALFKHYVPALREIKRKRREKFHMPSVK